jgi:hypothetical protein
MTWGEGVYMVLDELKLVSDDSTFEEEHIIFLMNKYRARILRQNYASGKKTVLDDNYQTIEVPLKEVNAIDGIYDRRKYLKSTAEIPSLLGIGNTVVSTVDYYQGNIVFVPREKMRTTGHNKWLKNIIYASLNDGSLYLKSENPQFLYLGSVKLTGIFDDAKEATLLTGDTNILDMKFPLEGSFINAMIQLIVQELSGAVYKPEDNINNSADDLADIGISSSKNRQTKNEE